MWATGSRTVFYSLFVPTQIIFPTIYGRIVGLLPLDVDFNGEHTWLMLVVESLYKTDYLIIIIIIIIIIISL